MNTKDLPKKIAVLMGGPGSERDVSLATGRGVSKALRSLGVEVIDVDVRDENFPLPKNVDLAFLTIHGTFGEDGQLQKILEDRGVAYTGDGVEESHAAFDKLLTKEKFRDFELQFDWKISRAGNSGVKYRIQDRVTLLDARLPKFEDQVKAALQNRRKDRAI